MLTNLGLSCRRHNLGAKANRLSGVHIRSAAHMESYIASDNQCACQLQCSDF